MNAKCLEIDAFCQELKVIRAVTWQWLPRKPSLEDAKSAQIFQPNLVELLKLLLGNVVENRKIGCSREATTNILNEAFNRYNSMSLGDGNLFGLDAAEMEHRI